VNCIFYHQLVIRKCEWRSSSHGGKPVSNGMLFDAVVGSDSTWHKITFVQVAV
jgi:hypothetical protein